MADFGVRVSKNGVDAKIATGSDVIMSSKFPLAKIDRNNPVSYQNVYVNFVNNLPLNVPTVIYQYAHGYKYKPSTWTMAQTIGVASPYYDFGFIMDQGGLIQGPGAFGPMYYVQFWTDVDDTYVRYYAQRMANTLFGNPSFNVTIAGVGVRIRTFVFAEDVNM